MNWSDINLFQYQQLVKALSIEDDIDKTVKIVSIVTGLTENEVLSMPIVEFNKEKEKLNFLSEEIKGKPVKYIKVNGRKYECIYDVRNIPAARYIETKVFGNDLVNNIHKIAATMVMPMKKTVFGWKRGKYDAAKHEEYAQDMLEARFVDVYHSAVFFFKCISELDKSFSGLFDGGTEEEESPFGGNRSGSRFLEVYGWHYTIYEAAKLHNITSDEVWNMKTIEYLNTLAYLKAYRDYQK